MSAGTRGRTCERCCRQGVRAVRVKAPGERAGRRVEHEPSGRAPPLVKPTRPAPHDTASQPEPAAWDPRSTGQHAPPAPQLTSEGKSRWWRRAPSLTHPNPPATPAHLEGEAVGGVQPLALPVGAAVELPRRARLVRVHVKHRVLEPARVAHHRHCDQPTTNHHHQPTSAPCKRSRARPAPRCPGSAG